MYQEKNNQNLDDVKELVSQDNILLQSVYGHNYIKLLEQYEKGNNLIAQKIYFADEKKVKNNKLWECVFRNCLLLEKENIPLIVYNFLILKLKERLTDLTLISLKNGQSNSLNFKKYLDKCRSIVGKHSTKNISKFFGDNAILSTTIKLSSRNSFIFSSTFKDTKDLRLSRNYTRFNEIKDVSTKSVPINKKNFPVNIFLLTSKKLENRPTKKYEVFLGKYVRSYLVNDAQDPINTRMPLSRKDSAVFGTVHNHLLNKDNVRCINNISRVNYQTKSESRNSICHVKLPISFSKSRSRPNLLSEDTFTKSKINETYSKVKIEISKFNVKSYNIRSKKKKSEMLKSFNKDDFYYI